MSKHEERRAANRERILVAATDLFFEHGYAGTTVEMICANLGVTKPFVYWYFSDKTEIIDTISVNACEIILNSLRSVPDNLSAKDRLRLGLQTFVENYLLHFKAGTFFYRELPAHSASARSQIQVRARRFNSDLAELLSSAIAEGAIPDQDTRLTVLAIGGIIGFMYTWYAPDGRLAPETMAQQLTEIMLRAAGWTEAAH